MRRYWQKIKEHRRFIRLLNWEYWSTWTIWSPMWVYGPYLALRSGHLCFFSATNPGMYVSGLGFESKYKTILKVPETYRPKTVIAYADDAFETIQTRIIARELTYPLIVKPDVGCRGFLVKKVRSEKELKAYLAMYPLDFMVQELIERKEEVGVFYYRFPDEEKGVVSSITLKEFLHVIGDGRSTVLELVLKKPRAKLQLERLQEHYTTILERIPAQGERVPLGIIGNHSKGTIFRNGNHLINPAIHAFFDELSPQLEGIYYGRFDIKCDTIEQLTTGERLKILEINGICSEPTHIYDPEDSSFFQALRSILQHWSVLQQISRRNHQYGVPYMRFLPMLRVLWAYRQHLNKVKSYEEKRT